MTAQSAPLTVFGKTLSDGREATVVAHKLEAAQGYSLRLYIDGQYISPALGPFRLRKPKGSITHYIGGNPALGLTDAEAKEIVDAATALKSSASTSFEGQRRELVGKINDLYRRANSIYDHAMDGDRDPGYAFVLAGKLRSEGDALKVKLDAFDLAHPEVKARIDRDQAERRDRAARD